MRSRVKMGTQVKRSNKRTKRRQRRNVSRKLTRKMFRGRKMTRKGTRKMNRKRTRKRGMTGGVNLGFGAPGISPESVVNPIGDYRGSPSANEVPFFGQTGKEPSLGDVARTAQKVDEAGVAFQSGVERHHSMEAHRVPPLSSEDQRRLKELEDLLDKGEELDEKEQKELNELVIRREAEELASDFS